MQKNIQEQKRDTSSTSAADWCVYKHTSPSGKVYIGITHQKPEYRWRDGKGYKNNAHFWNAIKKYGRDNFTHEVLRAGLTQSEAEQYETELVAAYGSSEKERGYNIALGGHALSEESRKKIGDTRRERGIKPWHTGKHLPKEMRDKISAKARGNQWHTVWTEEEKERLRQKRLGANNPNYGKPLSAEKKEMLAQINRRPVMMNDGEKENVINSIDEASRATGINATNICRVCKGQRQTAGGFAWKYA